MNTLKNPVTRPKTEHARNVLAAFSSIIPGLGHIYKGHYLNGAGLLIISPFVAWAGVLIGIGTLGLGLVIPFAFLMSVAWHAYAIEDWRHHTVGIL